MFFELHDSVMHTAEVTMLHLKGVVALLFLFGIIGIIFIKHFNKIDAISELSCCDHNIEADEVYTRRLPDFLIIGAKKCGTSK